MVATTLTKSERVPPGDARILIALLDGHTQRKAAELCGVSESTVRRRLGDPGFQRRLQEAQEEAIKRVRRQATAGAERAMQTLVELATNDTAAAADGASVRANAARAILAAFVQLQPRHVSAEVATSVRYVIDGVDMGAMS